LFTLQATVKLIVVFYCSDEWGGALSAMCIPGAKKKEKHHYFSCGQQ
jgi:hypothetical protein